MAARTPAPPPRMTPKLTRAIAEKAAQVKMPVMAQGPLNVDEIEDKSTDRETSAAPASPLDWIAHEAGVKKQTLRRWMRMGANVRALGYTGPIADRWIDFVDAVDALVAACSNYVSESIALIARSGDKKALDALIVLQKRIDRHEAELEAVDVDTAQSDAVSHIPQEVLDQLTEAELEALEHAQLAIAAARERVDLILDAAHGRTLEP
jgi:hypothetical protein